MELRCQGIRLQHSATVGGTLTEVIEVCFPGHLLSLLFCCVDDHLRRWIGICSDWSCHGVAGEINTLQGNLNWVASREHSLTHPVWEGREPELLPLCNAAESDSANLDHVAELLMRTGVASEEALMILVPEAYDNHPDLQKTYPEVRRPYATIACI